MAAFKIQSHFDVKRSYNPGTGEELNVIEENANDSPWYDRQFMRVDWSKARLGRSTIRWSTKPGMTAIGRG